MSYSISGKTAIVTGAAKGVGLAIARHFLDCGANVVFADMDEASLIAELGEGSGGDSYRYFAGDLREKLTIANLLSTTMDAFDHVDILVNASRQIVRADPLSEEDDSVSTMLEQNLMACLHLSQGVARLMIQHAGEDEERGNGIAGSIVNLSSIASNRAHPDLMAYSVSTAALNQMTRSMAVALADRRVRVNAVSFGSLMSASLLKEIKENPGYRREIIARTPLGRIASADELAETVQFLASDAAGFITGQVLTVDGGRSLIDAAICPAH